MSTAQLSVLWYAGITISAVLLNLADRKGAVYGMAAIVVMAGILIYSLGPHPQARKRLVSLIVLAPFLVAGLLLLSYVGYSKYHSYSSRQLIKNSEVEMVDWTLGLGGHLEGRVKNNSRYVLKQVDIAITVKDGDVVIEDVQTQINVHVPPGQARDITENVYGMRPLKKSPTISWDHSVTGTVGED